MYYKNLTFKNQSIVKLRPKININKKKRFITDNNYSDIKQKTNDPKWKQFVKVISNPSYGVDGIKKHFPKFTEKAVP
jgi:hypothetical protein